MRREGVNEKCLGGFAKIVEFLIFFLRIEINIVMSTCMQKITNMFTVQSERPRLYCHSQKIGGLFCKIAEAQAERHVSCFSRGMRRAKRRGVDFNHYDSDWGSNGCHCPEDLL